jgi:Domain of unknown function (DUF4411)
MAKAGVVVVYCADTSALIDMKNSYPMATFRTLWGNVSQLVAAGRFIAPPQVLEELERGDDELTTWARNNRGMFRSASQALFDKAKEVLGRFPDLVDRDKPHEDADPYVVALAAIESEGQMSLIDPAIMVVLTQEHRRIGKSRIPHAAEGFGLECIGPIQLLAKEGWQF